MCCKQRAHKRASRPCPVRTVWSKRLAEPAGAIALLAVNVAPTAQTAVVTFDELLDAGVVIPPTNASSSAALVATDVWTGEVAARLRHGEPWRVHVADAHDSRFVVLSPAEISA